MKAPQYALRSNARPLTPDPLFTNHGAGKRVAINLGIAQPLDNQVSFLRLPEVKAVTGLSKTSLYELIRQQSFPAPVRLGQRAVAWVRSEVNQWAADRILASRSTHYPTGRKLLPSSALLEPRDVARRSA